MDYYDAVRSFHKKFELDHHSRTEPSLLLPDVQKFREDFLDEELDEFKEAIIDGDIAKAADALVDLVYVALGTAHLMGLDFDAHFEEVQKANMAKERSTGTDDPRSKRRHQLDVVKPVGWKPPDHLPILKATGWKGAL